MSRTGDHARKPGAQRLRVCTTTHSHDHMHTPVYIHTQAHTHISNEATLVTKLQIDKKACDIQIRIEIKLMMVMKKDATTDCAAQSQQAVYTVHYDTMHV